MEDHELLRAYWSERSESAFAELVNRHLALVYSTALRVLGQRQLAEEVGQMVFLKLARKAAALGKSQPLAGWLYRTSCRAALSVLRAEQRRGRRETQAMELQLINNDALWPRLAPFLEDALAQLSQPDQDALILRCFEGKSLREVGQALGLSEDAAHKRVSRAVDKLRAFFAQRRIYTTAALLESAVAAHAVQAAPSGLAAATTNAVLAKAAAPVGLGLLLLKCMSLSKLQTAAICLAAGLLPTLYQARQLHSLHAQQERAQLELGRQEQTLAKLDAERDRLTRQLRGIELAPAPRPLEKAPASPTPASPKADPFAGAVPPNFLQPYPWVDDSPVVRIPKALLQFAGAVNVELLTTNHLLSNIAVDVLGMNEEEVASANHFLARAFSEYQAMETANLRPSDRETSYAASRQGEKQSFTVTIPAETAQEMKSQFREGLEQVLGTNRIELAMSRASDYLDDMLGKRGLTRNYTVIRPAEAGLPVTVSMEEFEGGQRTGVVSLPADKWQDLPQPIAALVAAWTPAAP